jgi:hypothetical protein
VTVVVVALICVVVAIGAGLQGAFSFTGPRWIPGVKPVPPPVDTSRPTAASSAVPSAPVHPGNGVNFGWIPILIVLALIVTALAVVLVRYLWRHRIGRVVQTADVELVLGEPGEIPETEADLPTLHRGLLRAADVLETSREPRDAIVRAWLGLQEAAEDSGLRRRPSETPTEFTTRVFSSIDADALAAAALLTVYLRVRFRSIPATDDDVLAARSAIQRLRETWPAAARTNGARG